jgi:hypothetical protein
MATLYGGQIDRIRSRTGISHSDLGWFTSCDGPSALDLLFHSSRKLKDCVLVFRSGFRWDAEAAVYSAMERDPHCPLPGFS